MGYRMLAKNAQLCTSEASYPGYQLRGGKRSLSQSRIAALFQIPAPKTKRQIQEFLGVLGNALLILDTRAYKNSKTSKYQHKEVP